MISDELIGILSVAVGLIGGSYLAYAGIDRINRAIYAWNAAWNLSYPREPHVCDEHCNHRVAVTDSSSWTGLRPQRRGMIPCNKGDQCYWPACHIACAGRPNTDQQWVRLPMRGDV